MSEILVLIIFKDNSLYRIELFSSCTKLCKYINENILNNTEHNLDINNVKDIDKILESTVYKGTKIEVKTINI